MYIIERNLAKWEKIEAILTFGINYLLKFGAAIVTITILFKCAAFWYGV